jgi:hypothetical protein
MFFFYVIPNLGNLFCSFRHNLADQNVMLTHRSVDTDKGRPNSNRNAYTALYFMFIFHLTAIRLHLTAISLYHFHIFQVKCK